MQNQSIRQETEDQPDLIIESLAANMIYYTLDICIFDWRIADAIPFCSWKKIKVHFGYNEED